MYSVALTVSNEKNKQILYIGIQGKSLTATKQRAWRMLEAELSVRGIRKEDVYIDMQIEKDGEWIDSDEGAIEV